MKKQPSQLKRQQFRLSFSLYLNYVVHGFGLLILSQNMTALGQAWNSPLKIVSFVISGIGIGRLLAYLITGYLSDRLSRKFFVYLGMACYFAFAIGIPFSKNIYFAYFLAILAGIANSALDAGTYTTFAEMSGGRGNILIKAVVSVGEFILPLLVSAINLNHAWFGISFMTMAALLAVNALLLLPLKFPEPVKAPSGRRRLAAAQEAKSEKAKRILVTICFVLYGYASMALMIWFTQWITLFGQEQGLSAAVSHLELSLYSAGSIIGVIMLFSLLGRGVSDKKLMVAMNLGATAMIAVLLASKNPIVCELACLVFGLTAASGVMQTGLNAFMRLYPARKGLATGVFYFFGALASFTVPIITGVLSDAGVKAAFGGDLMVGLAASCLTLTISLLLKDIRLPELTISSHQPETLVEDQ